MTLTLEHLNHAAAPEAAAMLAGLYEHSPWIAEQALQSRPFTSLAHLKYAMSQALDAGGREAQLALIRAHPQLAGKLMEQGALTAESQSEQSQVGLTQCSASELAYLRELNQRYLDKFGWPFILAVRGPRGTGLRKKNIIETFERRLQSSAEVELKECLRQIHRIVELRLNDKFGVAPTLGNQVWDWHERLAQFSDPGFAEQGQLAVTYLTAAHRACAQQIAELMRECGFDEVSQDAVGNVVGRYLGHQTQAPSLLTGSHYDTVRNAGRYDGRLGILVPIMSVRELARQGQRLPYTVEVVAFSEEEGQRFAVAFLGSSALVGNFDPQWLSLRDSSGTTLAQAMRDAGLDAQQIGAIRRDPKDYLGFVEVHIEQGPVLNELHIPLGIVTSINGSLRYECETRGTACHAGTTPMALRADAACGVAELMLFVEQRAAQDGSAVGPHKINASVGTVGMLQVPNGSINVVPGRCLFSLDLRAPTDTQRDALARDVLAKLDEICARRHLHSQCTETLRAAAAPSDPLWQQRWEDAVQAMGLPVHRMTSGAGHDAMKLHQVMPQAMLFVRGENGGISHNPLESTTSDDMQLAIEAFSRLLTQLSAP